MRIAFVGITRKYKELAPEYRNFFNQYHLELPYYYASGGQNEVTIVTVDRVSTDLNFVGAGALFCTTEENFLKHDRYDVVIHWRKWIHGVSHMGKLNLVNCQDQSFSIEWIEQVRQARERGELDGILCFPTWHKRNTARELGWQQDDPALLAGVTLGVDSGCYFPSPAKDPYRMLWASDPGRGLQGAIQVAMQLYQLDSRFRLHICYPDYCAVPQQIKHPALVWEGNVPNGPALWNLFNECGVLPYTSTFMEPSSRAHRQAQSAGSLVLYPPNMGSPSELIEGDRDGVVSDPKGWPRKILQLVNSGAWKKIGAAAREKAVSENWDVQARRFNVLVNGLLERKG